MLLALLGSPSSGFGETALSDEEIRSRMALTRQQHDALLEVRKTLNRQLLDLEVRQGDLARKIQDLDRQAKERQRRIRQIKDQRDVLDRKIRQQQAELNSQLRSAHVIGQKDWLKLLMNQEDAPHLARVLAFYGYLSEARSTLVRELRGEIAQLEDFERELNDEMTIKGEIRKQSQSERAAMSEATLARKQLLKGWDRTLSEQVTQMREDQKLLDQLLVSVALDAPEHPESPTAQGLSGAPAAPCPPKGTVTAKFGSPRMAGRWDGILISGKEGVPVHAVAPGRVAFADWFRGYGLLTILDHGNGVMTLYAFNQALSHAKGDQVAAGDVIATLGSSGGRDRPGLYFGVRSQGKPVDPQSWCKGIH